MNGKSTTEVPLQGGNRLENTHEFVEKLHDTQKKDKENKEKQGKGHPDKQLPNNQHN